ncbi:transposase [Candidatus Magnetoovum chiemensis]|nr:transposase [Candidatus Magnetoovum chiemensis]
MKKEPKNFSCKVITAEVNKRQTIEPLYRFSTILIPKLGISNENIRYYAFLVSYYSTSRLKRIKRETVYLYLICFVFHRYQKINDDLINTFIYYVRYYINKAKQYAKEQVYENKSEGNKHLQDVAKILDLFTDKNIPIDFEFTKVKKIAFDIMPEDKFPLLVQYLLKESFDETEYEWNHYLELSQAFKKNLRRIFLSLLFKKIS